MKFYYRGTKFGFDGDLGDSIADQLDQEERDRVFRHADGLPVPQPVMRRSGQGLPRPLPMRNR
ncbi:hypothetical protein H6F67_11225 [Microcoleus sp. FACHB-1515]|uniref:hypothetical protein n=1 Tax=Cyanophyceae TaxID=3028117 RepID=UPI001682129C|nr:hypothetical protein [Microcoleus sp. FACHB-1515]MBD2090426.1 hypothetical protein [Microcoleus sp. FACHB-1515]